jgi:hypothetical protein
MGNSWPQVRLECGVSASPLPPDTVRWLRPGYSFGNLGLLLPFSFPITLLFLILNFVFIFLFFFIIIFFLKQL